MNKIQQFNALHTSEELYFWGMPGTCYLPSLLRKHHGYKEFFINARTDTYLQKDAPLTETIERAKAYVESGASGVFLALAMPFLII